jgi:hypothetical protein
VRALHPGANSISTDVCVPISRLAECVDEAQRNIANMRLLAPIVGHVGDGLSRSDPFGLYPAPRGSPSACYGQAPLYSAKLSEDRKALSFTVTVCGALNLSFKQGPPMRRDHAALGRMSPVQFMAGSIRLGFAAELGGRRVRFAGIALTRKPGWTLNARVRSPHAH